MLTEKGQVKVADSGLARVASSRQRGEGLRFLRIPIVGGKGIARVHGPAAAGL